jgi:hypothetical protein
MDSGVLSLPGTQLISNFYIVIDLQAMEISWIDLFSLKQKEEQICKIGAMISLHALFIQPVCGLSNYSSKRSVCSSRTGQKYEQRLCELIHVFKS